MNCSYYNKEALFRGKIDLEVNNKEMVIELIDYKSGRVSMFPQPLQLVMYCIWAFQEYPNINEIRAYFIYVEHLEEKVYKFKRDHLSTLNKKVLEKIYNIEQEINFKKVEGPLCNYCSFREAGLCEPETNEEFQNKMFQMIKPYKRKNNG